MVQFIAHLISASCEDATSAGVSNPEMKTKSQRRNGFLRWSGCPLSGTIPGLLAVLVTTIFESPLKTRRPNQQWALEDAGDGFVRIRNRSGAGRYLSADGNAATLAICSAHQQTWKIVSVTGPPPTRYRIVLSAADFVIDLDHGRHTPGTEVLVYSNNGGRNQEWIFEDV
ncbi:carbohydrate-binding module family 13 protein [Hydnum rufescens UP504]|uniref:Carbohydrate-binding module family 13 protein n=1 Tax=Hydnum rufescens UP504 TaxID=1448309 RepID=A0A9P6B1F9_9AGAM|nr:carbohydrate-binding module family 13 protein [Hydnum rufescens UP504]